MDYTIRYKKDGKVHRELKKNTTLQQVRDVAEVYLHRGSNVVDIMDNKGKLVTYKRSVDNHWTTV